jgi:hypothetical protein
MSKHGVVANLLFGAVETTLAPIVAVTEMIVDDRVSDRAASGVLRGLVWDVATEVDTK